MLISTICFIVGVWVGIAIMSLFTVSKCSECLKGDERNDL